MIREFYTNNQAQIVQLLPQGLDLEEVLRQTPVPGRA
jgi:hypothetical protein